MSEPIVIGDATLYLGDCMDILPTLPRVDAAVTDPPYLTTDLHFDKKLDMHWVEQLVQVVKNDGYLMIFCPFEMAAEIAKIFKKRFTGIWLKPSGGMRAAAAKKPISKHEPYYCFAHPNHNISNLTWNKLQIPGESYRKIMKNSGYKRGGKDQFDRINPGSWTEDNYICENDGFRLQTDVIYGPSKQYMKLSERTEHPTQKPINVIGTLIGWGTNNGDTVLDCFLGSGTTGVAAIEMGRKFIGIEKDPKYFDIACKRIERAVAQGQLFQPEPVKQVQEVLI